MSPDLREGTKGFEGERECRYETETRVCT